jgi:indole-3-glycerol phosphate synthase
MTSKSGSADVLDALGIRIDHDAASPAALREHGFAFLFAPNFHPAMRHAGPTRREIGVRTAFNLLGPLTNPAGTRRQLLGVADDAIAARMAEVVARLGTDRTFVIHGDGVDELPLDGSGVAWIVHGTSIERHVIDASALGFKRAATSSCSVATRPRTHAMTESVLRGEPGSRRDVVLLNAAAALLVAGAVGQMEEGIERRALTIDAGLGAELLETLRAERRAAESRARRPRRGRRGETMTVADRRPPVPAPSGERRLEIAARRRADVVAEARPPPAPGDRGVARRRAPPADRRRTAGAHRAPPDRRDQAVLAVGRPDRGRGRGQSSPGRARTRPVAAAAISVLCEPHWFGGSVDDLRAIRAAVAVPVLAKEFVVDEIQLPMLRAAGADIVLLLALLHPAARLARLVARALEIGLEPLVEAHDARELDRALATRARIIGINNRDLRTLRVDVERAARLRELVPDDRLVVAESGVRDPATVARWRAVGFDAALVGEALVPGQRPGRRGPVVRRGWRRSIRSRECRAATAGQDLRHHRRGGRPGSDRGGCRRDRSQRVPGTPRSSPWTRLACSPGWPVPRAERTDRSSSRSPPMRRPTIWAACSTRSIPTSSS